MRRRNSERRRCEGFCRILRISVSQNREAEMRRILVYAMILDSEGGRGGGHQAEICINRRCVRFGRILRIFGVAAGHGGAEPPEMLQLGDACDFSRPEMRAIRLNPSHLWGSWRVMVGPSPRDACDFSNSEMRAIFQTQRCVRFF